MPLDILKLLAGLFICLIGFVVAYPIKEIPYLLSLLIIGIVIGIFGLAVIITSYKKQEVKNG